MGCGSTICKSLFFVQTQITNQNEKDEIKSILEEFILTIHDSKTGAYFAGEPNDDNEIINGAMKVLTGFDWLNISIHSPEKLIDFVLIQKCDMKDVILWTSSMFYLDVTKIVITEKKK